MATLSTQNHSKPQPTLLKIINFISSKTPTPSSPIYKPHDLESEKNDLVSKGLDFYASGVDLDLRLGPMKVTETETVMGNGDVITVSDSNGDLTREITSSEGEAVMEEDERESYSEGCYCNLDLLVEAARVIEGGESGRTEPGETSEPVHVLVPTLLGEKYEDIEDDIAPVVRSKRGRNQVLPYKYRDSVLEPWKPISRRSTATKVSNSRANYHMSLRQKRQ